MKALHRKRATLCCSIVTLAVLCGCGGASGGASSTAPPTVQTSAPSTSPSATPQSPQPSQSSLVLQSPGAVQFSVTEPGYKGTFSETDTCDPYSGEIAAVVASSNASGAATYAVTPVSAGTCSVTLSDSSGRNASVSVSIATAAITVQ